MTPPISVVLPVYNGERYLREAVDSILGQSFREFELIIVDDGSTDGTPALVDGYAAHDSRVRVVRHSPNRGLIAALNAGCQSSIGRYIAMMHADDISLPERLERQFRYLEQHPEIGILGASAHLVNPEGQTLSTAVMLPEPGVLGWVSLFSCPFVHPTVMMRREIIEQAGYYQEETFSVEDYDLWMRASRFTRFANLTEPLLRYRIWPESITSRNAERMERISTEVVQRGVTDLLGTPISFEAAAGLRGLADSSRGMRPTRLNAIRALADVVGALYRAYTRAHTLTPSEQHAVARDAALKYFVLARLALRQSPAESARLLWRGLRLSPRAPLAAAQVVYRKGQSLARS